MTIEQFMQYHLLLMIGVMFLSAFTSLIIEWIYRDKKQYEREVIK